MAESRTVRVAEYGKAVTKMCVVQDIILNWNKECGSVGEIVYQSWNSYVPIFRRLRQCSYQRYTKYGRDH